MKLFLLIACLYSQLSFSFIPNISNALGEVFEGRKGGLQEMFLKHRVFNPGGEPIEIEETILYQGNRIFISFKIGQTLLAGEFSDRKYKLPGMVIPARTLLFLKYLVGGSADDYREIALREQFIKREYLTDFQPTFKAEGDPQTWALKDNYIKQDGVSFKKLKQGVGVAYRGNPTDEGEHILYLDPSYKGVKRIEWLEGKETHAWNFDGFSKLGSGYFPRVIAFESNGAEIVVSNLVTLKQAREKNIADFRRLIARPVVQPSGEGMNALKTLLSYR